MDTTKRSTCWSLTINNPTEADEESINLARQNGWKVTGQKELGTEGTPHYQLMLRTPQVRFSAVKKAFPRAHIEVAREPSALAQYVEKLDTRVSQLPVAQEKYPSLTKLWDLVERELNEWNPYITTAWENPEIWDTTKAGHPLPDPLDAYHICVSKLIRKGYHVESLGTNPATISQWKRHFPALLARAIDERSALETTESVSSDETQHAEVYQTHQGAPRPPCPHRTPGDPPFCASCTESARASVAQLHP